ncbi:MAG: patatin-like phospholipase family protein [Burkholderiaceae bacterium]
MLMTSRRTTLKSIAAAPVMATSLGACSIGAGPHYDGRSAPEVSGPEEIARFEGCLALVLSSGGPRGFVHVGVLQALDEIGFRPDLVVGASVGALLAALYCAGLKGRDLRKEALEISVVKLANVALGADETFNGAPLARFVNEAVDYEPIEKLRPHCAIAALEQKTRQPVLFTRGNTGAAVQASAAIEGRFTPVKIRGRTYVDLDEVNPLPVRLTRALGAGRILSVDASAHEDRAPSGSSRYRAGDLRKRANTLPDSDAADLNLHPFFGYWVSLSEDFRRRAINAGYEEVMRQRSRIERLMQEGPSAKHSPAPKAVSA